MKNDIFINKLSNEIKTLFVTKKAIIDYISFLGGASGISLFHFYASQFTKTEEEYTCAFTILEETVTVYSQTAVAPPSMAKMGWMLNHLDKMDMVESDIEELLGDINPVLNVKMTDYLDNNNYDFLHGALGIVLYFLSNDDESSDKYVSRFIDAFEQKAEPTPGNGLKWLSMLDYKTGKKGYNISMSHGIASIVAMLSKIYKRGINPDKTKYLLEGAMNYLLQQKLPEGKFVSVFPNLALESMENLYPSRLAWCYGDLGISVAIWHASQAMGQKDWEEEAKNILLHSAKRRDLKENGVVDAGLCHGTAGIAHIFNRMYGYTGMEELKEASDYWFEQTLKMARFEDGLAGFKAWQGTERGWVNEPGLLEGIAGIGLAMISAVSDIEPAWDECLLLS